MSLEALRGKVKVKSLTSYILSVTATDATAPQAEAIANAVANSTSTMSVPDVCLRMSRRGYSAGHDRNRG